VSPETSNYYSFLFKRWVKDVTLWTTGVVIGTGNAQVIGTRDSGVKGTLTGTVDWLRIKGKK
jgi:hypothetical protein